MKKMLVLALALCLSVGFAPVLAEKEDGYAPALGMTIDEFVSAYNRVQAPLGAPYRKLPAGATVSQNGAFRCASYMPAEGSGIEMLAVTFEKKQRTAAAGADAVILLCHQDADWLPFIATANRVASLFSTELFGVNYSGLYVGLLASSFYENRAEENDQYIYYQLGADSEYCCILYKYGTTYAFILTSMDQITAIMGV